MSKRERICSLPDTILVYFTGLEFTEAIFNGLFILAGYL